MRQSKGGASELPCIHNSSWVCFKGGNKDSRRGGGGGGGGGG